MDDSEGHDRPIVEAMYARVAVQDLIDVLEMLEEARWMWLAIDSAAWEDGRERVLLGLWDTLAHSGDDPEAGLDLLQRTLAYVADSPSGGEFELPERLGSFFRQQAKDKRSEASQFLRTSDLHEMTAQSLEAAGVDALADLGPEGEEIAKRLEDADRPPSGEVN